MIGHSFYLNDGKKNPSYAENFKHAKYLKIVTFVGYQQNYVESVASNEPLVHEDVKTLVEQIAPTAIITSINVFKISEFKNK